MSSLLEDCRKLHEEAEKFHQWVTDSMVLVNRKIETEHSQAERVDSAYHLKRMADTFEHLSKLSKKAYERLAYRICFGHYCRMAHELDPPKSVSGKEAIAVPSVEWGPRLPNKETQPDDYMALMDSLGVPAHVVWEDAVRPHWVTVKERVTTSLQDGKERVPGVDYTELTPHYKLTIRKKTK